MNWAVPAEQFADACCCLRRSTVNCVLSAARGPSWRRRSPSPLIRIAWRGTKTSGPVGMRAGPLGQQSGMSERDGQDADSGTGDEADASRTRRPAADDAERVGRDDGGAGDSGGAAAGEPPTGTGDDSNRGAGRNDGTGEPNGSGDSGGAGAGIRPDHGDNDRDTGRDATEPPGDDAQQRPFPGPDWPTPASSESALVQTGRAVTAALTVLAAIGGLILGVGRSCGPRRRPSRWTRKWSPSTGLRR